jgi:hypothetical protein
MPGGSGEGVHHIDIWEHRTGKFGLVEQKRNGQVPYGAVYDICPQLRLLVNCIVITRLVWSLAFERVHICLFLFTSLPLCLCSLRGASLSVGMQTNPVCALLNVNLGCYPNPLPQSQKISN